jgi:hypothetical protein
MKIQKFNESLENTKDCVTLIITDNPGSVYQGVLISGAFETKTDMENWLLNMINEELVTHDVKKSVIGVKIVKGIFYNKDEEPIFIDLIDAINWYQDFYDCNVYYDEDSSFIKNEPLMYGVELARAENRYNL